jgi:hypothetical protein
MSCVSEILVLKGVETDRNCCDGCVMLKTDIVCKYMHFVCRAVVQVSRILRELCVFLVVKIETELNYLPKKKKKENINNNFVCG